MRSGTRQKRRPRRRRFFRWFLAVVLILVAAGWTWGWHRGAQELNRQVERFLAEASQKGSRIDCPDHRIEGFPFGIVLACDSLSFASDKDDTRVEGGRLHASYQLYRPTSVTADLVGPLTITSSDNDAVSANWKKLSAQVGFNLDGWQRFSLHTNGFNFRSENIATPASGDIGSLDFRFKRVPDPTNANPGDIDFRGGDIALMGTGSITVPPFSLSADLRLDDLPTKLDRRFDLAKWLRQHGLSGQFRKARFETGANGSVEISGPFQIARNGRLSARLKVSAADLGAITDFLANFLPDQPEQRQQLEQASTILAATGFGGSAENSLRLTIRNGKASVGILPLGEIPPLF